MYFATQVHPRLSGSMMLTPIHIQWRACFGEHIEASDYFFIPSSVFGDIACLAYGLSRQLHRRAAMQRLL
jgi:hypothetical protein